MRSVMTVKTVEMFRREVIRRSVMSVKTAKGFLGEKLLAKRGAWE